MKLAVVTVLRNEIDIVRPFLSHLAALFDYARLLDHGSVDGTASLLACACAGRPGWADWRVEVAGHHQAQFAGFAMCHLFETTDSDMVVFLDADEFLDVPDRAALDAVFAGLSGRMTARFFWSNCLPARLDGQALVLGDPLWERRDETPIRKIAISRALYEATGGLARPSSGGHRVEPGDGVPVEYVPSGRILHVPVRSAAQFRQKIVIGALGVFARSDNGPHESTHWFGALRRLEAAGLSQSELIHLAARYGHPIGDWTPVSAEDLPRLGFTLRSLDVAGTWVDWPDAPAPTDPWRVMAASLLDWQAARSSDLRLELEGQVVRQAMGAHERSGNFPPMGASRGEETRLAAALKWATGRLSQFRGLPRH